MIQFIDDHKDECGVELFCRHLPIAPQTYYAARTREPSLRSITDEGLTKRIHEIHTSNYGVYGVRKVHAELCREGRQVARCTVERLMKKEGLRGIRRVKGPRTTISGPWVDRPADLVERRFTATTPDCLWAAAGFSDSGISGFFYAARAGC
jgi:putative transposase